MKHRLHMRRDDRIVDILAIVSIATYLSLEYSLELPLPDTVVFVFPLAYAMIRAKDEWYVCVFWACILSLIFLTTVPIVFNMFTAFPDVEYNMLLEETTIRVIVVIVTNIILFICIRLTTVLRKEYSKDYWSVLLAFLFVVFALLVTEEAIYALQNSESMDKASTGIFICAYAGILVGLFLTIILFHIMSRSMENENKYRMEVENIEKTKKYTNELEMMYKRLTEAKHDLKHHYQIIDNMVMQGNNEQAKNYLQHIQSEIEQGQYRWTGSCAVDALILAKSMVMKRNGIDFHFDPYPLKSLPIPEADFCAMLGNILDNAIEGVCRLDYLELDIERKIQLSISRSKDMLYLYAMNPCDDKKITKNSNGFISAKESVTKTEHGLGIRSIQRIVREHDGRCEFFNNDKIFTVKIVFPYAVGGEEHDRVDQ